MGREEAGLSSSYLLRCPVILGNVSVSYLPDGKNENNDNKVGFCTPSLFKQQRVSNFISE